MASFPSSVPTTLGLLTSVNNLATTLNGAVTDSTTAITVASTSSFPSSGDFTAESEVITYTGKNATQFTGCSRGADGTSAAAHNSGVAASHFQNARYHNILKEEIIAIAQNLSDRIGLGATQLLGVNGTVTNPTYSFANSTGLGWYRVGSNSVGLSVNGAYALSVDSSKRLLMGSSSARQVGSYTAATQQLQIEGTNASTSSVAIIANSASGSGGTLSFAKTRATAIGGTTIVQSGDDLGYIEWAGSDGTSLQSAAVIMAEVDTTPGAGDMPGRLSFLTTPDGSTTPAERVRINSKGQTLFSSGTVTNPGIGWLSDTTGTGIYLVGADNIGIATGGVLRLRIDDANLLYGNASTKFLFGDGSVTNPSMTFFSDQDCGFRRIGTNNIGFGVNATGVLNIAQTAFDPVGAGTVSTGTASNYWNDISYKTLTDRGCLGSFDDGVEMPDGKTYSDLEALSLIKKHPTNLTIYGKPMLDYRTFPVCSYKPAMIDGVLLPRDKDNEPIGGTDGAEMTSMFSIFIGAFKQIDQRLKTLEAS